MKAIKKILYLLIILLIGLCAGILVCALNPALTQSLADRVQALVRPSSEAAGDDADGGLAGDVWAGGYVAPDSMPEKAPEEVDGLFGYQPVTGETEQIPQEEADNLSGILSTGETGEGAVFPQELYPYHAMLNPTLQQLYRQVYANALELNTSFAPVAAVSTGQMKNVMEAVYNDHPELFWLESEYSCKYLKTGICVELTLKYNAAADDLPRAKEEFEARAEAILAGARQMENVYGKEQYVHDALVQVASYDVSAEMGQSAYSALVEGKTVCAGYARAFQYLLQQMGIPCYYCTGYAGQDHAWNVVRLGTVCRNVDVTWDDTDPATYDYYNKSDSEIATTHVRTGLSIYLPACVDVPQGDGDDSPAGIADAYVNPNPQTPLRWPDKWPAKPDQGKTEEEKKKENLDKAGITEAEVLETLQAYYKDCRERLKKAGAGDKKFSNVIPESLWPSIEKAYGEGGHRSGYVDEALKELKVENFEIQIQVQRLGGGYCRIYHNICTY